MKRLLAFIASLVFAAGLGACGGSNDVSGTNSGTTPTPTPTAVPATPTPTPVPTPVKTPTPTATPTPPAAGVDSVSLIAMYPPGDSTLRESDYIYFKIGYSNAGHPNAAVAVFFSVDGTTRVPTSRLYNMVGNGSGESSASSTLNAPSVATTNAVILVLYDRLSDPDALRPFASSSAPIRYNWSHLYSP